MNPYFTAAKLDELEKDMKTVAIDAEGRALPVEYDEMFVRGTILKLIADSRAQKEWMATVIRHYGHVVSRDLCVSGAEFIADQSE